MYTVNIVSLNSVYVIGQFEGYTRGWGKVM